MPDTRPGITFDEEGVCCACRAHEKKQETNWDMRFEELKNLYLTGGGTHPGSGLPTIYQSGKIVADLITKELT